VAAKSALGQIWAYAKSENKWFLLPILLVLLAAGLLLLFAQSSALAPFIYTIF
jgi:hypothetical protein